MTFRPTAYGYPDIEKMVHRLAITEITDDKVEFLARAVHAASPWAGTPIKWDDWTHAGREDGRRHAREVLTEAFEARSRT